MKKYLFSLLIMLIISAVFIRPAIILAESQTSDNLNKVGSGLGNGPYQEIRKGENDLAGIVGIVIQAFLGLLGIIFLVYIILAGYNWLTAQGDEEKVAKAKETIQRAVIGLIIIIAAYAISYWVFWNFLIKESEILN